MRVFVTGATGFVGVPTDKELIAAGHEVLGMARYDEGAKSLAALGSDVHRGSLEDLEGLRKGAAGSDAVIHLAFIHDWSNFAENFEIDRRAIEALGFVLAGSDRLLIVTGGAAGLAGPGVRASVMRFSEVHDTVKQGLLTYAVAVAREKGVSAYVGKDATAGQRRMSRLLPGFTGLRWKRTKRARSIMRSPKKACRCATWPKPSVAA